MLLIIASTNLHTSPIEMKSQFKMEENKTSKEFGKSTIWMDKSYDAILAMHQWNRFEEIQEFGMQCSLMP